MTHEQLVRAAALSLILCPREPSKPSPKDAAPSDGR
jgi:hypothetical protein